MPFLIYQDNEGKLHEMEFSEKQGMIRIGSDPAVNDLILPPESGVTRKQAVVMRSAVNKLPLLVNLAGQHTRVNGRQVETIQVLRQKDEIQLGQALVTWWEVRIVSARAGDRAGAVGKSCPVCLLRIQEGDEVVICPRCRAATHRLCWFSLEVCAKSACGYPVKESIIEALSPWVAFDRKLDEYAELVRKHKTCQALERGYQIPFQEGDYVIYCPSCQATYHLLCWLGLERCKVAGCGHEIQKLLEQVFKVKSDNTPATAGEQIKGGDHVK